MATTKRIKKLYTFEDPVWLNNAGFNKGIHHDRQHLAIILSAGAHFKIRKIAGGDSKLNLRLLNADSKLEKSVDFGAEWLEIVVQATSVPFVDTPYGTQLPKVEYEYDTATSKTLPIYKKYDPESTFFAAWDSSAAEFALIESDYVLILVPACDKEDLRKLKGIPNINALVDYFDRVLTFYNQLAGLSFEPDDEFNKNIRNRYFLKADLHGAGGAYYGGSCAAATSSSIAGWWLTCQDANWGNLHEIAHGYQGGFMNTRGFSVGEVWNNVYAASYQNIHLGERVWKEGWLYDYGKSASVFQAIQTLLRDRTPVDQWNLRSKLNFLMLLKDRGGDEAFTHFNQKYRKHTNEPNFDPDRFTLLDMLSAEYSRVSKIDTTAFIQRAGGLLSPEQIDKNHLFHEKVVYPLCELVKAEELAKVQDLLHLRNPLALVDPSTLKQTGFVGDLSVSINIDHFPEIYGEKLFWMEGQRYAFNVIVKEKKFTVLGIPIGVYTMILPTGKGVKYSIDTYYAVVRQGVNELVINYTPKTASSLLSVEFKLLGLSNSKFGSVRVYYPSGSIEVGVTKTNPHSYFEGSKYAQVTVKSDDGAIVWDKAMEGTKVTLSNDKIPFKEGYQLVIFHAESKGRLVTGQSADSGLLTSELTNTFTLSTGGVTNNANTTAIEYVKNHIAAAAAEARKNPRILRRDYDRRKDDIYLALQNYPITEERAKLLDLYKDLLPKVNETPGTNVGNAFLFAFQGYYNVEFMTVRVDFVRNQMLLNISAVEPHVYFGNQLYASIRLVDSNGVERLNENFLGNQMQKKREVTIPINYAGGEEFYVHHSEAPTRLVLTNEMQDKKIPVGRNTVFKFVATGLEVLYTSPEEKDDPPSLYSLI